MRACHKCVLRAVLLVALGIVVAAMVIPASAVAALFTQFGSLRRFTNFLDTVGPAIELDHVLAFAALGLVAYFAWRCRTWQAAVGFGSIAVAIELVQLWIPGRDAAVSHALLDTVGGVIGFSLARALSYACGGPRLPSDAEPSTYGT
jgi:glycopeptide antibiotics resistance protein